MSWAFLLEEWGWTGWARGLRWVLWRLWKSSFRFDQDGCCFDARAWGHGAQPGDWEVGGDGEGCEARGECAAVEGAGGGGDGCDADVGGADEGGVGGACASG